MWIALVAIFLTLMLGPADARSRHHHHHKKHHVAQTVKELEPAPRTDDNVPYFSLGEIDDYLFEVYQRVPTKTDSSGDFTWKDSAAAERLGMDLKQYVIGGMAAQFRKRLFVTGQALDAAGFCWSILSGFRDDYRQRIAEGFKAHGGNSWHGGSNRGGYGNGRAIDIINCPGTSLSDIWKFIDDHPEYGLTRPMASNDPDHVQQSGLAVASHHRTKLAHHKSKRRHA